MTSPGQLYVEVTSSGIQPRLFSAAAFDSASAAGGSSSSSEGTSTSSRSPSRSGKSRPLVPTVIIDKSALFRAGLAYILAETRFVVTASCSSLRDLSESVFSDELGVALISIDKQATSALPQVASLTDRGVRVIMLSEQFHPEEVFAVIEAGVDGYLLKNEISPDALVKSLELVWLGGVVLPQEFTKLLKDRAQLDTVPTVQDRETVSDGGQPQRASDAAPTDDVGRLSSREQMILMQLTQGASNKQIARDLGIAEATVKVHVKSLLRKIRVSNRTQAAMWATGNWHKAANCLYLTAGAAICCMCVVS
jgi:two-component system nitrate/nitrite response regulator NarL